MVFSGVRVLWLARGRMRGVLLLAGLVFAGFVCITVAAPTALAGITMHIELRNETGARVALVASGPKSCMDPGTLNHPLDQRFAAPRTASGTVFYVDTVSYDTFDACHDIRGVVHPRFLGLKIKLSEVRNSSTHQYGPWYTPEGAPANYELRLGSSGSFTFENSLGTWVPREDGYGLVCWHTATHTDETQRSRRIVTGTALIMVYQGDKCNTRVPADIKPTTLPLTARKADTPAVEPSPAKAGDRAGPAFAAAGEPQKNTDAIVNLLSTIGVACPWYAYPNDKTRCDSYKIATPDKWVIPKDSEGRYNVASVVRDFTVKDPVLTRDTKSSVCHHEIPIPANAAPGTTVSCIDTYGSEYTKQTTTQHGFEAGASFQFEQSGKVGLPGLGEGGARFQQELSFKYSWSKSAVEGESENKSRSLSVAVVATPGYLNRVDVFTPKDDGSYLYNADLDLKQRLDESGNPLGVSTPASVALGQSPSEGQPCLAYAIGGKETRNSIMYIGQQLLNAGKKATDRNLGPPTDQAARSAFLSSIPRFTTSGESCKGFPAGYASEAGFKGAGVGKYRNLGYDADGRPVQAMLTCLYLESLETTAADARVLHSRLESPTARPAASGNACKEVSVNGGKLKGETPGKLIDVSGGKAASDGAPDAGPIVAPPGSDEIFGPNAGGTIYTNNGALDIAHAGAGPTRIIGGSGENVLYGGPGKDVLVGGHLGINYLHAGTGPTTMEESNGTAIMYGGAGRDTFEGRDMTGVMVGGRGSSRMVGTGKLSHLKMEGGTGPNTYVLEGSGTPTILQLPERAPSTVMSDHSIVVPEYVHNAIATGSRPVTLTGSFGTRSMTANAGGDKLISGPDPETLRGARGPDTIEFNPYNDDVATGGRGADHYTFSGSSDYGIRPAALAYPARRTAATITDFKPANGDRPCSPMTSSAPKSVSCATTSGSSPDTARGHGTTVPRCS